MYLSDPSIFLFHRQRSDWSDSPEHGWKHSPLSSCVSPAGFDIVFHVGVELKKSSRVPPDKCHPLKN